MFTPATELWKGLTDIPLALLALVFGFLLLKKGNRPWGALFLITGVAAVLGAGVHALALSDSVFNAVWVILYILLYEAIRRFSFLMDNFFEKTHSKEKPAYYCIEAVLYICTVVCQYVRSDRAILVLVLFMVISLTRFFITLWKHRPIPGKMAFFLILLVSPIALQALAEYVPYAVVAEHLILAVAFYVAYRIALDADCT